jgi:hypothetical protein
MQSNSEDIWNSKKEYRDFSNDTLFAIFIVMQTPGPASKRQRSRCRPVVHLLQNAYRRGILGAGRNKADLTAAAKAFLNTAPTACGAGQTDRAGLSCRHCGSADYSRGRMAGPIRKSFSTLSLVINDGVDFTIDFIRTVLLRGQRRCCWIGIPTANHLFPRKSGAESLRS